MYILWRTFDANFIYVDTVLLLNDSLSVYIVHVVGWDGDVYCGSGRVWVKDEIFLRKLNSVDKYFEELWAGYWLLVCVHCISTRISPNDLPLADTSLIY